MFRKIIILCGFTAFLIPVALADELTEIIQKDLTAMGYDPGNISGEATMETVIAISKFQAENNLEVTGQPTPQLAGIIKSRSNQKMDGGANLTRGGDPAALEAARQACIQEKVAKAQASQKKKRGFGKLLSAATRTVSRIGGNNALNDISRASRDIYDANATAGDLKAAAKDLGLTEDDLEACRNPAM